MQVSGIQGVNFSSRMNLDDIDRRAAQLEARADALNREDVEVTVDPMVVADMLDGKLKATEKGRNFLNTLTGSVTFAAAVVSFKKIAPKLRSGISKATQKVAASLGSKVKGKTLHKVADEVSQNAQKIGAEGTVKGLEKFITKIFGKENGPKIMEKLSKIGVQKTSDVADLVIATGAAVLAGHEAGDRIDAAQKDASVKDAVRAAAKAMCITSDAGPGLFHVVDAGFNILPDKGRDGIINCEVIDDKAHPVDDDTFDAA